MGVGGIVKKKSKKGDILMRVINLVSILSGPGKSSFEKNSSKNSSAAIFGWHGLNRATVSVVSQRLYLPEEVAYGSSDLPESLAFVQVLPIPHP